MRGGVRTDGPFFPPLPSLPATLSDPASDHAGGPGHHPAHVHSVHQPNLGRPSHAGDRGLKGAVAASLLSAREQTRTSMTCARPARPDERICFCVSVLDRKPIVGRNLRCTVHLPLVGMREYPADTDKNAIFLFLEFNISVYSAPCSDP